jgi:hypothetical protein
MSTNSRQRKAKNPKVQAVIDAINEGIKVKRRYYEARLKLEKEEDERLEAFLAESARFGERMGMNKKPRREPVKPLPLP